MTAGTPRPDVLKPLTAHALGVLRSLRRGPVPHQEINPGVVLRLQREALIELVELPSPYTSHKGKSIGHCQITQAGIDRADEAA